MRVYCCCGAWLLCVVRCTRHVNQVMELTDACSAKAKQDKLCGNSRYHAAGDRKGRAETKRATGRFLLGCPHLILLSMATMPAAHGHERYGYAYLMMAGECWCSAG